MEDFIIIALLVVIVGAVAFYLYKSKKRGDACVGCPYAKNCTGKCSSNYKNVDSQDKNG